MIISLSSTYGDSKTLPKQERCYRKPLSPYAVTKLVNELYADVFYKTYGTDTGLRYFNVFGPKQSPTGAYAAVIPLFMKALKTNMHQQSTVTEIKHVILLLLIMQFKRTFADCCIGKAVNQVLMLLVANRWFKSFVG